MTGSRLRPAFFVGLFVALLALQGVQSEEELEVPEELCRPYIEKALKDLGTGSLEQTSAEAGTDEDKNDEDSHEDDGKPASEEEGEPTGDVSREDEATEEEKQQSVEDAEAVTSAEEAQEEAEKSAEGEQSAEDAGEQSVEAEGDEAEEEKSGEEDAGTEAETEAGAEEDKEESSEKVDDAEDSGQDQAEEEDQGKSDEGAEETEEQKSEEAEVEEGKSGEEEESQADEEKSDEAAQEADEGKSDEEAQADDGKSDEEVEAAGESAEEAKLDEEKSDEAKTEEVKSEEEEQPEEEDSKAEGASVEEGEAGEDSKEEAGEEDESKGEEEEEKQSQEQQTSAEEGQEESKEGEGEAESTEGETEEAQESEEGKQEEGKSAEDEGKSAEEATTGEAESEEQAKSAEEDKSADEGEGQESVEEAKSAEEGAEEGEKEASEEQAEETKSRARREVGDEGAADESAEASEDAEQSEEEPTPEEDLIREIVVPENLRPRDHLNQLLKLDEENEEKERAISKIGYDVLKELKRVYDNAIQPLESLYKYRDLSNRHFGDPEIFSKPLVLFMGPWSGGKSSIINYLLDIEYKQTSLRTGAEPSPAYFNILMHGEEEEVLDGTQLAADWTFSGLQKFGQGLLDRLKGLRLDNKLLEKVNIVEIPGILEIRKQVQRLFPFNDACQWFIDRADIIFLVYDPSKLDVGPETEAILDQLKGREYQTRIILNKADQVKPEELMRVQGALIWNISPLMSSAEPPVMYSTSLWSIPYEAGAPTRLLYAQERAFLRDLRTAIDKQVEHKIASARRFAVRVRNHAKMVDCYLTTYYNHKTFFGNKKEISDRIVENPQDYHIYEGLSTLKNISRYDLPDPDVYRDFFRLNPLYDFPLLSSTCTYFRGCPINRLDVAIAYDLPELVGKYKKSVEQVIHEYETSPPS